jgi:hypothetical protein
MTAYNAVNGVPATQNRDLLTGARIAAHAPLPGLDDEDSKTTQFDPLATRQGLLHRVKEGVHCLLGFHLWYAGTLSNAIDDV